LTLFLELENNVIMGNMLSHDNPDIENVSIQEVKEFYKAVKNVHEKFVCVECGRFVKYYRDLHILRCRGKCDTPLEIKCK